MPATEQQVQDALAAVLAAHRQTGRCEGLRLGTAAVLAEAEQAVKDGKAADDRAAQDLAAAKASEADLLGKYQALLADAMGGGPKAAAPGE